MKREPVAVINALIALVEAAIAMYVILGELGKEQAAGIMAIVLAVGNLIKILWARKQVTPVVDPRDNEGHVLTP